MEHIRALTLRRDGVDTATVALWLGPKDVRATRRRRPADLNFEEKGPKRPASEAQI